MNPDSHFAPYFASNISPVFGLNHLGLRNASEDLFTTLLPGLNGVTQRVRYYSFYCWITGVFSATFTGDDRTDEAYRLFIRKSEILLALLQARRDPGVQGIPGITYALDVLGRGNEHIDLLRCVHRTDTKPDTKGTYWSNRGGILRQYYNASMKDMVLLASPKEANKKLDNVSLPSLKTDDLPEDVILGEDLGSSFLGSIGEETAKLFVTCVLTSSVTLEQLDKMKDRMVMKDFGDIGEEREKLIDMLNQKDSPGNELSERHLRRDTIRHLLKYFLHDRTSGEKDSVQFPGVLYHKVLEGDLSDECSLGWYAYSANDWWQYHNSIIFFCLLEILQKDNGWVAIEDVTVRFSKGIYDALLDEDGRTLRDVCKLIETGGVSLMATDTLEGKAAGAIASILRLFCENQRHPETVKAYLEAFRTTRRGNDFFAFMEGLNTHLDVSFLKFLKDFILRDIIYRHHNVSLVKYSATKVSSNKFLLEDGYLRFIEQTEYSHTAPRLDSLIGYLTDLGLLKDLVPTDDAKKRYNLA